MSEIEHYGVKGMKWGVRKKGTGRQSSDFKRTVPLRNRDHRELSNKQIQKVNARINLEQNYARLNPTKIQIGSRAVKGLLAALNTGAAFYTLSKSPAGQAAIKSGKAFIKKK
jgi:hypothetical protein